MSKTKKNSLNIHLYLTVLPSIFILIAFTISLFYDGGAINRNLMYLVLMSLILGLLLLSLVKKASSFEFYPLDAAVLIFSLILLFNPFVSFHYDISRFFSWELAVLPLTYFFFRNYTESLKSIYVFGIATSLFFGAWGALEFVALRSRVETTFYDANAFASLLIVFILPMTLFWLVRLNEKILNGRKIDRVFDLMSVVCVLLYVSLFATASRSGIVAGLIGLGLVTSYALLVVKIDKKCLLALVLIIFACWLFTKFFWVAESRDWTVSSRNQGFEARIKIWKTSLEHYQMAPWLGTGLGTFGLLYNSTRDITELSAGQFAHNDLLQFLHEGGPLLVLTYLFIILSLAFSLLRAFKNRSTDYRACLTFGLIAASLALFIQSSLTYIIYMLPFAMVIGTAAGLSINKRSPDVASYILIKESWLKNAIKVLPIFLLLALMINYYLFNVFALSKNLLGQDVTQNYQDKVFKVSKPLAKKSSIFATYAATQEMNRILVTDDSELEASDGQSLEQLMLQVLTTNQYDSQMLRRLAQVIQTKNVTDLHKFDALKEKLGVSGDSNIDSELLLLEAIRLNRFDATNYFVLSDFYKMNGNTLKAYEVLTERAYPAINNMQSILAAGYIRKNILEQADQNNYCDDIALSVTKEILEINSKNQLAAKYLQRCEKESTDL